MPDITLQCTCCGDLLLFPDDLPVRCCPACGTPNARARVGGAALDSLRHAIRQRLGNDFENAERSYQQVLREHPDSHEALWGRLLCHYGVEYVTDPASGRPTPTLHNLRPKPLRLQPEYPNACLYAPDDVRARYEQDAAFIDDAQAAIRQRVASCPPFDVYLCHLPGGGSDSRVRELARLLRAQGLRTFLAPEELRDVTGPQYEAGLVHALGTARLMLVVCSDADSLRSPMVRSEWSRYMENMDEDPEKQLMPLLYEGMGGDMLPEEFRYRHLSGVAMSDTDAAGRLMALVRKALGIVPEPVRPKAPTITIQSRPPQPQPAPVPPQPAKPAVQPPRQATQPAPSPVRETFSVRSVPGGCFIASYNGPGGAVHVPTVIGGQPVLGLDIKAFYLCETLRKVSLPEGLQEIGDFAFAGCRSLDSVQLPKTLRTLGSHAFYRCDALTGVHLPEELEVIRASAFLNCSSLESVNIPPSAEVQPGAFDGCPRLPQRTKQEIAARMPHKSKFGFRR